MGGLGFGQGYFGQYATGGTVPPDFPVLPDVIVLVGADVERMLVGADVECVMVPPDPGDVTIRRGTL